MSEPGDQWAAPPIPRDDDLSLKHLLESTFSHALELEKGLGAEDILEVEARFGFMLDSCFQTDLEVFCERPMEMLTQHLQGRLRSWAAPVVTRHVDYISNTASPDAGGGIGHVNLRLTKDVAKREAHLMQKSRMARKTTRIDSSDLSVRLAISTERTLPWDEAKAGHIERNPRIVRQKKRLSFFTQSGSFRVDVTQIKTSRGYTHSMSPPQIEVEIELVSMEVLRSQGLEAPFTELLDVLSRASKAIQVCRSFCHSTTAGPKGTKMSQPMRSPFQAMGLSLTRVSEYDKGGLLHVMAKIFGKEIKEFPGSMPVSLSHCHLDILREESYFVSEKTDGVRALLLIDVRHIVLIDRSFHFWEVNFSSPVLNHLFGASGPTLVDGELARNEGTGSPYLLVFDCIAYMGTSLADRELYDRLRVIGELINRYRTHVSDEQRLKDPFFITGKSVVHKKYFGQIANCFKAIGPKILYHEEKQVSKFARSHLTDGLIFTPAAERYALKTSVKIFKWKFSRARTMDLAISTEQLKEAPYDIVELNLQCAKHFCTAKKTKLLPADVDMLLDDCRTSKWPERIIAEFYFENGYWRYIKLRLDKTKPNHIAVAFDTLESIAENITMQTLIDVLNPFANDRKRPTVIESNVAPKVKQERRPLQKMRKWLGSADKDEPMEEGEDAHDNKMVVIPAQISG